MRLLVSLLILLIGLRATAQMPQETAPPADVRPGGLSGSVLRVAWKAPFDAAVLRIAVADTVGDGRLRVVALAPGPKGGVRLTIYRWENKAFVSEWSTEWSEGPAAMAVGRFASGVPAAQIVIPQGCYLWDGKVYVHRPLSRPLTPVGVIRRKDGEESILAREGADYAVYAVDPAGEGDNWLIPGKPLAPIGSAGESEYRFGLLRAAPNELEAGTPPEYAAIGLLGLWDVRGNGKPLRFLGRYTSKGQDAGSYLVLAQAFNAREAKEVWRSQPLEGPILDVSLGDPRGEGREGLVVLVADNRTKGRLLYLFTMERNSL